MDGANRQRFEPHLHRQAIRKKHAYRCLYCGTYVETGRRIFRRYHLCKECSTAGAEARDSARAPAASLAPRKGTVR